MRREDSLPVVVDVLGTRKNNREEGTVDGGEEGTVADCLIFLDVAAVVESTAKSTDPPPVGSTAEISTTAGVDESNNASLPPLPLQPDAQSGRG